MIARRYMALAVLVWLLAWSAASSAGESTYSNVRSFVMKRYSHGVPYEGARALGPEAIPALKAVLDDNSLKNHWVNAIATLAYIGAPQSFVALKGFLLTRFSGIVDDTTFQALNAVPVVMGTIPDTPDLGVAQFLRDGTNPARWETLPWKDRIYTHHQLALDLSGGCISGLACVPTPETAEFLEKLFIRPYANSQLSTIHEAIAVNREIRERGLAAYLHSLQQKLSRAPRKGTK